MSEIQKPQNLDIVKAHYSREITALNYQKTLQAMENITFSEDTLDQDFAPLKTGREILKALKAVYEKRGKPKYEEYKLELDAFNSLFKPMEDILNRKSEEYSKLAKKLKAEKEQRLIEQEKIKSIQDSANQFILDYAGRAGAAMTDKELIEIERMINLETSRKEKYGEYFDQFKTACDGIRKIITDQKSKIKEATTISKKVQEAIASGNDEQAVVLMEKEAEVLAQTSLNKDIVQEVAINSIIQPSKIEVLPNKAPKPKRVQWEIELIDPEKALKAFPDFVVVKLDTLGLKQMFAKMRNDGSLKGKDITINGIRYFEKEIY